MQACISRVCVCLCMYWTQRSDVRGKFVATDYPVRARSSNKNWKRKCASERTGTFWLSKRNMVRASKSSKTISHVRPSAQEESTHTHIFVWKTFEQQRKFAHVADYWKTESNTHKKASEQAIERERRTENARMETTKYSFMPPFSVRSDFNKIQNAYFEWIRI